MRVFHYGSSASCLERALRERERERERVAIAMAYEMVHARIVQAHAVLSRMARDHPGFEANSQMQSVALQETIRTGPVLGLPSSCHFLCLFQN